MHEKKLLVVVSSKFARVFILVSLCIMSNKMDTKNANKMQYLGFIMSNILDIKKVSECMVSNILDNVSNILDTMYSEDFLFVQCIGRHELRNKFNILDAMQQRV